jgi:transcriptional regulator with XRE-family HTH domain
MGADTNPYEGIGQAIMWLRLERGATRREVKDRAGISLEYLGKIERCQRQPQPDVVAKLAGALETTPAQLMARAHGVERDGSADLKSWLWDADFVRRDGAGSMCLLAEARALRRERGGRKSMIEELDRRLDQLSEDELALLVASLPVPESDSVDVRTDLAAWVEGVEKFAPGPDSSGDRQAWDKFVESGTRLMQMAPGSQT